MLEDVKNYLNIRYDDTDTDDKISKMIERGKSYIANIYGGTLDFVADKEAESLLMEYCRYAWNEELEKFEKNYQSQLIAMRLKGYANVDI